MGALIRNRTSTALRRVRTVLRTGLDAQLAAINTDLGTDSGADYLLPRLNTLPRFTTASIQIAAQGPIVAERRHLLPQIRITSLRSPERIAALGLSHGQVGIEVSTFLAYADLTVADPLVNEDTIEGLITQALHDFNEAVKLALTKTGGSGLTGNDGLQVIGAVSDDFEYFDLNNDDEAIALRGVLTVVVQQRKDFVP